MEAKAPSQPQPKKPVEKPVPVKERRKIGPNMLQDYSLRWLSFSYSLFLQKIYLARKSGYTRCSKFNNRGSDKKLEADGFVVGEEHQERNHEEIEKGKL